MATPPTERERTRVVRGSKKRASSPKKKHPPEPSPPPQASQPPPEAQAQTTEPQPPSAPDMPPTAAEPTEPPSPPPPTSPPPSEPRPPRRKPDYELLLEETMFELVGLEALHEALWQVSEFLPPGRTPEERRTCEHLHALLVITADRIRAVLDELEAELALPEPAPSSAP